MFIRPSSLKWELESYWLAEIRKMEIEQQQKLMPEQEAIELLA